MIESKAIFTECEDRMKKAITHFESELGSIRAGKASPSMLHGLTVESYGAVMPIDQVASITVPDTKTLVIQPWDKNVISAIERAIINANIGVTPSNNGDTIRLNLPPLTEERRKELTKQVRQESENAKVTLRNIRRDIVELFKKAKKEGMSEDVAKDGEEEVQKITDRFSKKIDELVAAKEKEIMTV